MTLPASFPLSMSQVATELGLSLPLSMSNSWVIALAGKSALPVSFSNLLGKTGRFDGNLTTQSGGTSPPTVKVIPNTTFFGGTIATVASNTGGGCSLVFSSTPNWTGKIRITNNTLGLSAVFTFAGGNLWTTSTGGGFIGTVGSTYSFTILPSS
ncbi:hypothetical protein L0Z31_17470 (plasmid) [Burkholderia vietnamiensis]|uniref:hypothetical protein n=1 Tax=Burkholderia vietnamiensis TaxID=60552 RepID=UPI00112C6FFB|nr:hypothetical protein [Burkholderia vietnamiensis]MCO1349255.1 hypothetical protein [Burkholderia vietnamiensis]MCO1431727.1 hypothetical protein [Burkholderia vietnamiensis]TPQ45823.1 hypothetical protein C2U71_11170 [Burkholderia ubonensis]UQN48084.1 hypothetical protein L0Y95_07455 [Burkholderia vietnamiensis]